MRGRAGDRHKAPPSTEVEDSKDIPFRGCQKSSSKACLWPKVLLSPSQISWLNSQLVLTAVPQTSRFMLGIHSLPWASSLLTAWVHCWRRTRTSIRFSQ